MCAAKCCVNNHSVHHKTICSVILYQINSYFVHIYHFIWGENVVFFRASLGHAGSNEVWPWLAPNCLSSLEECPPSQGTPSSKGGGRILAWRSRPMDKLQSSPDPLASFLSWAPLPLTPHRVQRKPWGKKIVPVCVFMYCFFVVVVV